MGGGGRDEVVQEEVEGEDDPGEAEDGHHQDLELREATNIFQDLLKPHVDETEEPKSATEEPSESGSDRNQLLITGDGEGGALPGRGWGGPVYDAPTG